MENNPSMQCSVCGQWKRLHGTDENGVAIQRFYSCCGKSGEHVHEKEVCDDCCKQKCPYRLSLPKDTVIIYYNWWGGLKQDRKWWTAEMNGEVVDYHLKSVLIKNAEEKGLQWMVIRYHKKGKGGYSIIHNQNK